jgi:hypothetical protein
VSEHFQSFKLQEWGIKKRQMVGRVLEIKISLVKLHDHLEDRSSVKALVPEERLISQKKYRFLGFYLLFSYTF